MAKTRLNKSHRDFLMEKASVEVAPKKEKDYCDTCFEEFFESLQKYVKREITKEEYTTLKKFNLIKKTHIFKIAVYGQDGICTYVYVEMPEDRYIELPVSRYSYKPACLPGTHLFDGVLSRSFNKWDKSKDEMLRIHKKNINDMLLLITNSKTFEDVVEVWSGAEKYREFVCSSSKSTLSTLDSTTINRIKAITQSTV